MSSLRTSGLLQPIGISPDPGQKNQYHIVYGNRRYLAAKRLGWETIPCIILDELTGDEFLVKNLTENIQRKNLSLPEEGRFFDLLHTEKGLTIDEIAARVGVSLRHVKEAIDAYHHVPTEFRALIKQDVRGLAKKGEIPATAAIQLIQNKRYLKDKDLNDLFHKLKDGELNAKKLSRVTRLLRTGASVKEALKIVDTVRALGITVPVPVKAIEHIEKKYDQNIYQFIYNYLKENPELGLEDWNPGTVPMVAIQAVSKPKVIKKRPVQLELEESETDEAS
jgi:ParB/RepB/Spo0J family partition protein